jgi:hypothetical protein
MITSFHRAALTMSHTNRQGVDPERPQQNTGPDETNSNLDFKVQPLHS